MRRFLHDTSLLFATLVALLLPFPWRLLPVQQRLLPALFGPALLRSDSGAQALLYGALVLLALLLAALLKPRARRKVTALVYPALLLYLAAVLARYGADKLLKIQFYLPEPNTLYTPLGLMDKDLLYWSTIGTSRLYSLFLGGTELLAALLLFSRRTRRAGLLLALSVVLQVLAVDLCFGISVRLFSSFLLLLALLLLAPDARNWIHFLGGQPAAAAPPLQPLPFARFARIIKTGMLLLIAVEALLPALRSGNWNDDLATRPPLHGAYAVLAQVRESEGGLPHARRLFVHRAGYLVLQDSSDALRSFPLWVDTVQQRIHFKISASWRSLDYRFTRSDSVLTLRGSGPNGSVVLQARSLPWRALPALR
ncbi:hypothetical protein [Flaviaesturariibacter terrae]